MEREKCYYKWFSKCFEKIKRNVENKNSVDYSMTSEEIVFLQKQPREVFCKKGVFRNFAKFRKAPVPKSIARQNCNLIRKETLAQVFSC